MTEIAAAIVLVGCGFILGKWLTERTRPNDSGTELIHLMVNAIRDSRQFCGDSCAISRTEEFVVAGERYSIEITSEGDGSAVYDDDDMVEF